MGSVSAKARSFLLPLRRRFQVGAWQESIARLRGLRAGKIYVSHFGRFTDVEEHLAGLEDCLLEWTGWIRKRLRENKPRDTIISEFDDYITANW